MPVDFITPTKQDLDLEHQGLNPNFEKQEVSNPAQQVSTDLTRSLFSEKIDLENSYRFIKECDLPNTHAQRKQEFLGKINKAIKEATSAYQAGYIALTHGADLAHEFVAADLSSAGLTAEQSKKVKDLAKKERKRKKERRKEPTHTEPPPPLRGTIHTLPIRINPMSFQLFLMILFIPIKLPVPLSGFNLYQDHTGHRELLSEQGYTISPLVLYQLCANTTLKPDCTPYTTYHLHLA